MDDKNNFIPRHGSPLFYPEDPETGSGSIMSGTSRRKFLKRSGGATASAIIAWHSATLRAEADGGDSFSVNTKTNEEVTKDKGPKNPTPDDSSTGLIVIKNASGVVQDTIKPRWRFSMNVTLGEEAQQIHVKKDCANCKVSQVAVTLIDFASNDPKPPKKFPSAPSLAGPSLTRGHTITAAGECSSTKCEPKVAVSGIGGEPSKVANSITISLSSKVVKISDSNKRIDWTIGVSQNIDIGPIQTALKTALEAAYPNSYTITVDLPNISTSGHSCSQTVAAACTDEEVDDGAECTVN